MKLRDQWSALFWLAVAGLVGAASFQMGVGTLRVPGPGLLPLLAAVFVAVLALLLLVQATLKREAGEKIAGLWAGANARPAVTVSVTLLLYGLLLERLGFLIATFGLMLVLYSVLGKTRFWVRAVTALATVLITYILFYKWLEVELPMGLLGF